MIAVEQPPPCPAGLARRFEGAIFDWDGTAVPDRQGSAGTPRRLIEALCSHGFDIGIVSGTNIDNVDGQLLARPTGPGRLYLCLNRGSEVYEVGPSGPKLLERRVASPEEEAALTTAAELVAQRLRGRGLQVEVVSSRLNRRKIDLIPEPNWRDLPKASIAQLVAAVEERLRSRGLSGLPAVVELAREAAAEAGLADARVTSDAKHVEIGLTDKADSARWLLRRLWLRGIGPRAVLLAGDELGPLGGVPGSDSHMLVPESEGATVVSVGIEPLGVPPGVTALGGGPAAFLELLRDQLERRERGELPSVGGEPGWTLRIDGVDPELERAHESLLSIADGRIGTAGSPVAAHPAAAPTVLAAGLYDGEGPETALFECPVWSRLSCELGVTDELARALDLHSGVLRQDLQLAGDGPLAAVLFSSLARPGTVAMRAAGARELLRDGFRSAHVKTSLGGLVVAASDGLAGDGPSGMLNRLGVYYSDAEHQPRPEAARAKLVEAERAGFDGLLFEQRCAWARRWEEADIAIEGDPELQLAVRVALFHLMASVSDSGTAAVGARGLSGPGYRGHVFWDSDVFVLPFLAATHPEAARAMLEYRLRRLPAARAAARALQRSGARFPWESAASGADVTPAHAYDRQGRLIAIRTGELEEHIVADVAWAASCYLDWTGDADFLGGPGRELLVDTARYWASRIRSDEEGRGHIYGVIGPDEYHEPVDDNAYTNVMARWNLRRAAQLGPDAGVCEEEREHWLDLAESLVDGYDAENGLYEQFAGFWELEPLVIADLAPRRPVAAELLLGRERVEGAQVVKQADVLMLHHLVPEEVEPGSLVPNLRFYEPRTAHGSSLSPGIHAALFARAGMLDDALAGLRLASRIDLDDLTRTTAGGLHLAAMGSVWQALALGFAGLRPAGDALGLDPRLPDAWSALDLRLRFRGSSVRVRIEPRALVVSAEPVIEVALARRRDVLSIPPSGLRLERRNEHWEVQP
jgi:trehalose/maltose hydrolase-like predicted phosphorylase